MLNELQNWDGKSSEDICRIYTQYCGENGFVEQLFDWPEDEHLRKGLSYLLKLHCDNGETFGAEMSSRLLPHLQAMPAWEVALHVLQSIASLEFHPDQLKHWERFIRTCLAHDNKFVRAWSYYAFVILSQRVPKHQEEARQILEMALKDEAPSVKARIRQMKAQGLC